MSKEVVLGADRSLLSAYNDNPLYGFFTCSSTKAIPRNVMVKYVCPSVPAKNDGSPLYAPLALRRVESVLYHNDFDVGVVHPDYLTKMIGRDTEVVGVSVVDPMGLGPGSTSANYFDDKRGEPFTKYFMRELMNDINTLKEKYGFKTIAGGPGAWQLTYNNHAESLGFDHVFLNEAEVDLPSTLEDIISGDCEDKIIEGDSPTLDTLYPLINPTTNGTVGFSNGCGRGCKFCTTNKALLSFPEEFILDNIRLNVENGQSYVTIQAEDFLSYKRKKGFIVNQDAVYNLFKRIYEIDGVKRVRTIHAALSSIANAPSLINKLSKLNLENGFRPHYFCQPGIETGSERLMNKLMRGKVKPFNDWHGVIRNAHKILHENKWVPCTTVILGFPGETREDVKETNEVLKSLKDYDAAFAPLFFVPIKTTSLSNSRAAIDKYMYKEQWSLLKTLWKHNKRVLPKFNYANGIKTWITQKGVKWLSGEMERMADLKSKGEKFYYEQLPNSLIKLVRKFDPIIKYL